MATRFSSLSHLKQDFVILTSPPASGKTFWIRTFLSGLENDQKKVGIISPLRALAEECLEEWGHEMKISIMTPEEWLGNTINFDVIILDEFHLYFYWGNSFRPQLWEAFFGLVERAELVIALTATVSSEIFQEMRSFSLHFDSMLWINHGNQKLKYYPHQYIKAYSQSWILEQIFSESKSSQTVKLIFCPYRKSVFQMKKKLERNGFSVVSCVGGEARDMRDKLSKCPRPHFIVATTVLSHGVNLPEISKIYLLYPLKNIDFWIQMVARGGRRGGGYQVIGRETPYGMRWSFLKNLGLLIFLSFKARLKSFYHSYLSFYES